MQSPAQGAVRLARAAGLAVSAFSLAAGAHLAGGGSMPAGAWSAAILLLVFTGSVLVTGRRLGPVAVVALLGGSQLVLHMPYATLPEDLQPLLNHPPEDNKYSLRINDYSEVEKILARLRESGATIDEMQLQQADLEDIFLQIMDENIV